jgi:hypothetical protein
MTGASRALNAGVLLAMLICRSSSAPVHAATLACAEAATLDALVACISAQMPPQGSNGYFAPTSADQTAWRAVVSGMLAGVCAGDLPPRLATIMQRRWFDDRASSRRYCLLMEVLDADGNGRVDRGWGTLLVDPNARRELHQHAPHALSDPTTEREALAIFRATESRGFLMAGAHRLANGGRNSCQPAYARSDMAHVAPSMFQATNEALLAFYGSRPWWAIQWHGMGAYECNAVNVYLSHGRNALPAPSDKISELKARLIQRHPAWRVDVAGSGACTLNATFNVQGRLLNGVPPGSVCDMPAADDSGRFIHIEQDPNYRAPADWVDVVNDVWPVPNP